MMKSDIIMRAENEYTKYTKSSLLNVSAIKKTDLYIKRCFLSLIYTYR